MNRQALEALAVALETAPIPALRTHCRRGHAFTADNLITRADGSRTCRTCTRARERTRQTERPRP